MKEEPLLLLSDLQKLINQVVLIDYIIIILEGEQVKKGQLLLEFDIPGIKEAGYEVTTPIVVTNSDEFNDVEMKAEGQVTVGVELLELS